MSTPNATPASAFTPLGQGATSADIHARKQAVTYEYHLLSRLRYDGLQVPEDLVNEPELGVGLVSPSPRATPRWTCGWPNTRATCRWKISWSSCAGSPDRPLRPPQPRGAPRTQPALHHHPRARRQSPTASHRLGQRRVLPANPDTAVSRLTTGPLTLMEAAPSGATRLFAAPRTTPRRPSSHRRLRAGRVGFLHPHRRARPGHRTRRVDGPVAPATAGWTLAAEMRRC